MISRFKRNALTVMSIRVGSAVGTFGFASAMSYLMPKAEYGAIALLMTVVVFAGIVSSFGQRDLLIREVSKIRAQDEPDTLQAQTLAKRSTRWSLIGGSIGGLIAATGFFLHGESLVFAGCVGILICLLSINNTWSGSGGAYKRFFWAIAPRDLFWRVFVVLGIAAVFFMQGETPVSRDTAAVTITAIFVVLIVIQAIALGRTIAPLSLTGTPSAKHLRKPSLNFTLNSLSGLGFVTLDVVIVGFMLGEIYAAEYYPANRLSLFALFFYLALNTVIAPDLSRRYAKNDMAGMQRLASIGAVLAAGPSVCFMAILWFGQDYIYDLFATATQTTVLCALILSGGQTFCALIGYAGQSLAMSGREAKVARVTTTTFVLSLIVVPIMTYQYGILGAAITMTGLVVVRELFLWAYCLKTLGLYADSLSGIVLLIRARTRKQPPKGQA